MDVMSTCKHCGKTIQYSALTRMWYHDGNLMTYCVGAAFVPGTRIDSSKAEPVDARA